MDLIREKEEGVFGRFTFADGDRLLQVIVTDEGVIMDAYKDGEIVDTVGRMADEWFEMIAGGTA